MNDEKNVVTSFWQYNVYADIRRGSLERRVKVQWGCRQWQFSVLSLVVFENFRDKANTIIN